MRTTPYLAKTTLLAGVCLAAVLCWLHASAAPAPEAREAEAPDKELTHEKIVEQLKRKVKFPGIDDPKTTLAEALDKLQKMYDLTIEVNEKGFKAEGVMDVLKTEVAAQGAIPPMQASLGKVLDKILARITTTSGGAYIVRREGVEITTTAFISLELGRDAGLPLPPLVCLKLEKKSLEEALRTLAHRNGVCVVLDSSVADKGKIDVTATFVNTPLDTAVAIAADMAGLHSVLLDNVIYVTTWEKAARVAAANDQRAEERARRPRAEQPNAGGM